jgi:NAD(P) transhydrogenase subunit alpha
MATTLGVPLETFPGEKRVAANPECTQKLRKLGYEVVVQAGAGQSAGYSDAHYREAGARIVPDAPALWKEAAVVLKVRQPSAREVELFRPGQVLLSFLWPAFNKELVAQLAERKVTALAMDAVPRITRSQRMDALSAMANVAGYRAVIEAAHHFPRFFPGQVTAAGRSRPAQVLILGAGVAGLAAIAAAKSLGAVVKAFDTRAASREQVESLGGTFIPFDFKEPGEGEGGYGKEMSEAYLAAEQALIAQHAKQSDVVITTALIPGKPAPQLVTSGAVVSMAPGSVIVDLAAEQGGNCALTERDQVVERFGVTIIGYTDLVSRMARQSSDLYATVLLHLLESLTDKEKGFFIDVDDEIHRGMLVLRDGELMWPPPKRPEIRAGAPSAPAPARVAPPPQPSATGGRVLLAVVAGLLGLASLFGPTAFLQHLTVFLLACVVGWHVIWNVTPALHTPLMSVTNAISGIILVGGMLILGAGGAGGGWAPRALSAAAVLLAAINVAGGFLVTQRMLKMFRREETRK